MRGWATRRNSDDELRQLERRAAATGAADDLLRLAVAQERADGAAGRFQDDVERMFLFARSEVAGERDEPIGHWTSECLNSASHLIGEVLGRRGYYGSDGEFGTDPGIAETFYDGDLQNGIVEALAVFDDERLMLTIGARSSQRQDNYSAWPENRLYTVESSGLTNPEAARNWWTTNGADRRAPWLAWSRARHELAVVDAGRPIHDRVRVPVELAQRWRLLHEGRR